MDAEACTIRDCSGYEACLRQRARHLAPTLLSLVGMTQLLANVGSHNTVSSASQASIISVNPSSLGRLISARRQYPGGAEKLSIFLTLSREIPKCRAAARALIARQPDAGERAPVA